LILLGFGVKISSRLLSLNFMSEHGGGHGAHGGHESHSSHGSSGGGFIEAMFNAVDQTVEHIIAEPLADLGLKAVEDVGKVAQQATNLGSKPAGGGGGHGGGHH
jgi:hypothetical protein